MNMLNNILCTHVRRIIFILSSSLGFKFYKIKMRVAGKIGHNSKRKIIEVKKTPKLKKNKPRVKDKGSLEKSYLPVEEIDLYGIRE